MNHTRVLRKQFTTHTVTNVYPCNGSYCHVSLQYFHDIPPIKVDSVDSTIDNARCYGIDKHPVDRFNEHTELQCIACMINMAEAFYNESSGSKTVPG
jgi:hypothetical protein